MKLIKTKIILVGLLLTVFIAGPLNAFLSGVVAYPNPFNPRRTPTLTIAEPGGGGPSVTSIKIDIYDITGDKVYSTSFNDFASCRWNGRNETGNLVRPGLYIIKIRVENSSGQFSKKIFRVLIRY